MRNELRDLVTEDKANYFYRNHLPVHVLYKKKEKGWENGWIAEMGADFFILKLTKEGRKKRGCDAIPVFFLELEDINELLEEHNDSGISN